MRKIARLNNTLANTGWLFVDKILRMSVNLIISVWIAKYLGPKNFGLLNYALSIIMIVSAVTPLGLVGIVVRDLVKQPNKKNVILGTSFSLRLISSIIGFCLLMILVWFNNDDTTTNYVLLILAFSVLFQPLEIIAIWFESEVKSKYTVISKGIVFAIISALKLLSIILNLNLIIIAWIFSLELILGSISLLIIFLYKKNSMRVWSFNKSIAIDMLKQSWPLIFSSMAAIIYMKVDQIMLKHLVDEVAVGIYSVAVRLTEAWYFIPIAIVSSYFPKLVKDKIESKDKYFKNLQKLLDLLFVMSFTLAIVTSFLSGYVIDFLFGEEYIESANVLSIQIWTGVFVFLRTLLSKWLINEGLLIYSLVSHGLGAVSNILLNLILIPNYGATGASIATLISYSVSTYLFLFLSRKTFPLAKLMTKSLLIFIRIIKLSRK
ncbi:flippase [Rossellomorea sp. NPDC071047]|uniref:flippase n=1 Tax=Rossellomorea sp. NPDC071047 TaxID=3390675 RepID=UPI003D06F116